MYFGLGGGNCPENVAGHGKESFAELGKTDFATEAMKQLGAEFIFQLDNLLGKRRLPPTTRTSVSCSIGFEFGLFKKSPPLIKLDLSHVACVGLRSISLSRPQLCADPESVQLSDSSCISVSGPVNPNHPENKGFISKAVTSCGADPARLISCISSASEIRASLSTRVSTWAAS